MLRGITATVQVAKLLVYQIAASVKLSRAGQVVEDALPVNRVPDQVGCVFSFFLSSFVFFSTSWQASSN